MLPVESHHSLHPVVRLTASATANAVAAAMAEPGSSTDSLQGNNNSHQEEMMMPPMSPTAMVACS